MGENKDNKISSAKKYIECVIDWWSVSQETSTTQEERRTNAHEAMVDAYDCNPIDLKMVTDNLDIWIDLPMERGDMPDITELQIIHYAVKLHNIIESKKFRDSGYSYVREETKRLRDIWYDKY